MRIKRLGLAAVFGIVTILSGCEFRPIEGTVSQNSVGGTPAPAVTQPLETIPQPTEPAKPASARVVAVGDDLVQTRVYQSAQKWSANGTYDFTKCYENVKSLIQAGDISMVNQETLIANDKFEISGSNFNFNSPTQLGDALVDLGFNVITMANNHALDKRVEGLLATLDYWNEKQQTDDVTVVGAYRNEADMNTIRIREVNGLKVAFLAFTEHTNGYSLPSGSPVKIIYTKDTTLMQKQIQAAKQQADAVIVSAHWGLEDTHTVSQETKTLAKQLVDWGADVIVGTHSHTAETMEYLTRTDGSKGFVFYSLGNFISAQTDNFNMVGEIANFTLTKNPGEQHATVSDIQVIPVITHYETRQQLNLRLYPYSMYNATLAAQHGLPVAPLGYAKTFNMGVIDKIIQDNIPEEFRKLN